MVTAQFGANCLQVLLVLIGSAIPVRSNSGESMEAGYVVAQRICRLRRLSDTFGYVIVS